MKFIMVPPDAAPNEKRWGDSYIWRNWYPTTNRQMHASDAAHQYLISHERYAHAVIIHGAEYSRKSQMWRIRYSLRFAHGELPDDNLYLSAEQINELLKERRNG